ncbi:MAG: hypothetical protein HC939_17135 [Pleurocapsa sp. SU_5_0]|nr:hypothetical protein [Pleurocapsa sp. SU_5_0]
MEIRRIRELVIIAMFADDDLMETLVLKGGNALDRRKSKVRATKCSLKKNVIFDTVFSSNDKKYDNQLKAGQKEE